MDSHQANINALDISPQVWWDAINHGYSIAEGISEVLLPDFGFKKWFNDGEISHESLDLSLEEPLAIHLNKEYSKAISNSYFFKVAFTTKNGVTISAKTLDELITNPNYTEKTKVFYTYRIYDLNHFVTLYFQHWLLFDTYEFWVKWQLYYDFIVSKCDTTLGGLYQYMWSTILWRLDRYSHAFKDVEQYKKFRDKLEDITEQSKNTETEFIKVRDSKKQTAK
jgi:hypothetical protein